jgi:hypothetical protein
MEVGVEFPELMEKNARLERMLGEAHAQVAALQSEVVAHTGDWSLSLERDGRELGRWSLPSNGDFEWEGEGLRIRLSSQKA